MAIPDFFKKVENKNRGPSIAEATFLGLMSSIPGQSWFSLEGEESLVAGVNLPTGTVTLTLPISLVKLVEKTGASSLPLPFCASNSDDKEFIDRMVRFATR